ncbi:hypothetical protein BCR34DRAFT_554008, partial [Clohesyomyces aquaticus]
MPLLTFLSVSPLICLAFSLCQISQSVSSPTLFSAFAIAARSFCRELKQEIYCTAQPHSLKSCSITLIWRRVSGGPWPGGGGLWVRGGVGI